MSFKTLGIPLLLILAGCNRKPANAPPPRYAVLRFENLSGDPSLEWIGRALDESLPVSLNNALDGPILPASAVGRSSGTLGQRVVSAPGISAERSQAIVAGANRVITGYIERVSGKVRITAVVRNLSTGKTERTVTATADTPYNAIVAVAQQLSSRAKPPVSTNAAALEAYATAYEQPITASRPLLDRATSLDPNFGAAWLSKVRLDLAHNDRAAAQADISAATQQKIDNVSRASLDMETANLNGDRAATIAAIRKMSSLSTFDPALVRSLAELETNAGSFKEAASDWARAAQMEPESPLVWNSLGYARSYAGDYAAALDAFQHYDRLSPADPNAQDSIGDLNYSYRKFKEAAASYQAAYKRQPEFEMYGDLYKAAWATFEAGDKPGADKLFEQYRAARAKMSKDTVTLIAADWLFRTGRRPQAIDSLRKLVSDTQNALVRVDALTQLVIWDLATGDREQAMKDAAQMTTPNSSASASIARFAALPSATPEEWEMRARRGYGAQFGSIGKIALGYALILDGKRDAATRVWKDIVDHTNATDFLAHAIYAQLQGKPLERPLLPTPENLNPFVSLVKS